MTPEALRAELEAGRLRPAYLLAGGEPLLREDALAALRERVLAGAPADFNFDRLEGPAASPQALADALRMLPVMAPRRLVWVRAPEEGRAGGKALLEALAELVPTLGPETPGVLVVTAARADRRERWAKAFEREPAVRVDCEAPQAAATLAAFAREEARRQGVELESGVAELLAERIGPQLLLMRQELAKLGLMAAPARRITRAHVEECALDVAEEPIWGLTDAIGEGRARDALALLARLRRAGAPGPVVLGTLASHFRKLLRLRSGGAVPGPPFVVRKLAAPARRYPQQRLLAGLRAIHQADEVLKGQGGIDPDLALERLVLGLST